MRKVILIAGLSTLLLGACGESDTAPNSEAKITEKQIEEAVNAAVEKRIEELGGIDLLVTEYVAEASTKKSSTIPNNTEAAVKGDFTVYPVATPLEKVAFTESEHGLKIYEKGSNVVHKDFEYYVTNIESIRYLESNATSNVLSADEGKQYIIVQINAKNIGDRISGGAFNGIDPHLEVYDGNGKILDSSENKGTIASYYLEQYGKKQQNLGGIERLDSVPYTLAYKIDSDLPIGSEFALYQENNFGYSDKDYKLSLGTLQ